MIEIKIFIGIMQRVRLIYYRLVSFSAEHQHESIQVQPTQQKK